MSSGPARGTRFLAWLALAVATVAAYAPLRSNGFLWWDDPVYVTENAAVKAGLSRGSLAYAFQSGDAANWHPLTWLAHMLDVQLFGLDPAAHHAVSLALHVVAAVLLGILVFRWTGRFAIAWFTAAVFALHPLHVESVAWASERKDVLSHLLFVLALHAWTSWVRRPKVAAYVATCALLALGLLAKPMLVSFPLVLLALDVWPFARVRWPSIEPAPSGPNARSVAGLVLEKLPFALLAAASCVVTFHVQRAGGAMHVAAGAPALERMGNAVASIARYAAKACLPIGLSPTYAWRSPWESAAFWTGLALLACVAVLAWRWRRSRPWFAAGWAWFVVALLPVLGLVQVGDQALADRYTYLPLTGLVLAAALGAAELAGWLRAERVLALAAFAFLWALGAQTFRQVRTWRDDVTLFTHALAIDPRDAVAHKVLGKALAAEKRWDESVQHLRAAVELEPLYAEAWWNLGVALGASGAPAEALRALERAAELAPWIADIHYNLGLARNALKREDEAAASFLRALELEPDHFGAHGNLGLLLRARGRHEEALAHFRAAVATRPGDAGALRWLALTLVDAGHIDEALAQHGAVLRANPKDARHAADSAARAILRARAEGRESDARALEAALAEWSGAHR